MNGNNGIQPTIELATTNGNGYPYPVMFGNNGFGGNGGFLGGDGIWALLLFALLFGNGGWGNNGNGGFFGGRGFDDGYAWLSNGQKEIMANTNNGFDTLHLSNQLDTVNSGIYSLSNQLCNCCADMSQTVSNGFYNAEISANNRQMANMNQAFNSQISTLNGFNGLQKSLDNCCCENRLGIANLNSTILSENCADRYEAAKNTRDIIDNANRNNQAILDKLCQLELDNVKSQLEAKNDLIDQLRQENLYARGQASQVAQTAELRANNATVANQLVSELRSCPIPSQPVYGNQPIFTCQPNYSGCGCNGLNQFV